MKIELNRNIEALREEIDVLQRAIDAVISSPEFRSLFGKTQFLDADVVKGLRDPEEVRKNGGEWTDRRTRGDHSINVAAVACRFIEQFYVTTFDFEKFEEVEMPQIKDAKYIGAPIIEKKYKGTENFPQTVIKQNAVIDEQEYEIYKLNKQRAMLLALLAGYSHDLGHTPFGHDGEDSITKVFEDYQYDLKTEELKRIMEERKEIFGERYEEDILMHTDEGIQNYIEQRQTQPREEIGGFCSFEHIEQSYINFLNIINRKGRNGKTVVIPDDLIEVIKWAILAHSKSRVKEKHFPKHISRQDQLVVHAIRTADKGDYQITDGYEMDQLMTIRKEQSVYARTDITIYQKLENFINEWIEDLSKKDETSDNLDSITRLKQYRETYDLWAIIYCELHLDEIAEIGEGDNLNQIIKEIKQAATGTTGVFKTDKARNKCIVKKLTEYYLAHYDEIPEMKMQHDTAESGTSPSDYISFAKQYWESIGYSHELIAIGFVSSLTNEAAEQLYRDLVKKRVLEGKGAGIEPVTNEDMKVIRSEDTRRYLQKLYNDEIGKKFSLTEKKQLAKRIIDTLLENKRAVQTLYEDRITISEWLSPEDYERLGLQKPEIEVGITGKGLQVMAQTRGKRYAGNEFDYRASELIREADKTRESTSKDRILKFPNLNENSGGDER